MANAAPDSRTVEIGVVSAPVTAPVPMVAAIDAGIARLTPVSSAPTAIPGSPRAPAAVNASPAGL
ncbi:hypothetical protein ACWIGI_38570 [Nocardia sp. NPDC055321]